MIRIAPTSEQELANLMRETNGFAWWYIDAVDRNGSGLVLIWAYGLPFLPGNRHDLAPADRPSLCLATYRAGRPDIYLLEELEPDDVVRGTDAWRFGRTTIDRTERRGRERWRARIDMAIPGSASRVQGTIDIEGPTLKLRHRVPAAGDHRWCPRTTCSHAEVRLGWGTRTAGAERFDLVGRGYVDGNVSPTPLQKHGIERWRWGRLALPGRELIFYQLDPTERSARQLTHLLEVHPDGRVIERSATLEGQASARSLFGPRYEPSLVLRSGGDEWRIDQRCRVDDGPFYLRFLTRARDLSTGDVGHGVSEMVLPGRIDVPWQRPFIRMRRHRARADDSMWLPLFSGPRDGRGRRLLQHWRRRLAGAEA